MDAKPKWFALGHLAQASRGDCTEELFLLLLLLSRGKVLKTLRFDIRSLPGGLWAHSNATFKVPGSATLRNGHTQAAGPQGP